MKQLLLSSVVPQGYMPDPLAPRFGIVTFAIGREYRQSMSHCLLSKRTYAERHRYSYYDFSSNQEMSPSSASWHKVNTVLSLLTRSSHEWLCWMDADTFITDLNKPLCELLKEQLASDCDLNAIFSRDPIDRCNAGIWFIRQCVWSSQFLAKLSAMQPQSHWRFWEQSALTALLDVEPRLLTHIAVTHPRVFNSFCPRDFPLRSNQWRIGDFLVHFAGLDASDVPLWITQVFPNELRNVLAANEQL